MALPACVCLDYVWVIGAENCEDVINSGLHARSVVLRAWQGMSIHHPELGERDPRPDKLAYLPQEEAYPLVVVS